MGNVLRRWRFPLVLKYLPFTRTSSLLSPCPLPPSSPLSTMSDNSLPIICFSSNVKGMDDWASRTGIPLTSADALGTTYTRAHRWLLRLKSDLVNEHGWRDVSPADPRMLFSIECPSPFKSPNGLPRTPALRIEIPVHATSFFSPERRVQWEMVFHGSAFPALRHNTPVGDVLNILQCLLTGMIVIVREENVPGEGLYKTSRALPPADWVSQNQTGLTEVFGPSHFKSLFKAASDTTKAFRLEKHPNKR